MDDHVDVENKDRNSIVDATINSSARPKGKTSRRRGGSRPASANSATSRSRNPAGATSTAKPQGNRKGRTTAKRGSGMRGDGASTGSFSAPVLSVVNGDNSNMTTQDPNKGGRRLLESKRSVASEPSDAGEESSPVHKTRDAQLLLQMTSKNQGLESRCRHLEQRCTQLEVEASSKKDELVSFKAGARAKSTAVGKAEIILNEVCLAMASRLGSAEGAHISANKGRVLLEMHETPAEFAAQIKKNALLQLSKWEVDRAALVALAERAGDEAAVAAKLHEAERADLSAHAQRVEERIREMEHAGECFALEAETAAEESRQNCQAANSAKEELLSELESAATRNKELARAVSDNEKSFQAQLDRFMEYPTAAESMAEKLDKCLKSARREQNLVALEREEFRRQLHLFQKWQTENKDLRRRVKLQNVQALTLRRQLAVAEAGLAGSAATRKAVVGGTVDRLQRAEVSARHQANKYRELAGARGVRVAQLETEVSSLKATAQNLRRMHEAPAHDLYETEIARLARVSPEVVEVQHKSGLSRDDMYASMAQLKLLREKEEQKDALIALARERDEFELCIRDLKARNVWLEKQVLGSPAAFRSVACERVAAVAQSGEAEYVSPGAGNHQAAAAAGSVGVGGWAGAEGGNGDVPENLNGAVSRLERRLEASERAARGEKKPGVAPELTARIRRNIQFLEDCDRSIEEQRTRDTAAKTHRKRRSAAGHGSGVAAVHAARARQRPQSAQGPRRISPAGTGTGAGSGRASIGGGSLFRGARGGIAGRVV